MLLSLSLALLATAKPAYCEDPEPLQRRTRVGPVEVIVRLEPPAPVIGDTLELTLEVRAEDGIELLMPEFGESLDRFAIIDFAPSERVDSDGYTVATQRYTLGAPFSGEHDIPPIMVEFVDRRPGKRPAPEGEDAYEIVTERIPFEVASVSPGKVSKDMAPPLGELDALNPPSRLRWPALTGLGVLALGAGILIFRFVRRQQGKTRRRDAYEIAHAQLAALMARRRPAAEAIDAFFVELSGIVRRYLEDRFELRSPELTTEEFLDVASGSPDLNDDHRRFLRDFLRSADMVKFARFVPGANEIEEALEAATRFVEQTREAPRV